MSHEASRWAWRLDLPMRDKFVLLALADWADDSGITYPARSKLVTKCGISLGTVARALQQLVDWGLIEKSEQFRQNGSQTANLYLLRLDRSAPVEVAEATRASAAKGEGVTESPPSDFDSESAATSMDSGESSGEGVQDESPPGSHSCDSGGGFTCESPMTRHSDTESPPLPPKPTSLSEQAIAAVARVEAEGSPERGTREGFWQLVTLYQQANWKSFIGDTAKAMKRWDKLTIDERIAAIAKFPGYVRMQKALWRAWKDADPSSRSRQPKPATLEEYLGNRLFRDLPVPIEEPALPKSAPVSSLWAETVKAAKRTQFDAGAVFVDYQSPDFADWIAAERRAGIALPLGPRRFPGIGNGRFFVSASPPRESDFAEQENKTGKVTDGIQAR